MTSPDFTSPLLSDALLTIVPIHTAYWACVWLSLPVVTVLTYVYISERKIGFTLNSAGVPFFISLM